MEYKIYRQFQKRFWPQSETYTDLCEYLGEHQIEADIDNHTVRGQVNGLKFKVTFGPTLAANDRFIKTEMKGKITHPNFDDDSQRKAAEVLALLAQYLPKNLRK